MSSDSASTEREQFMLLLNDYFSDIDEMAFQRHIEGAEKYGPLKFLGADTLQEALEEVLDLINYARYTAVKIKLLQGYLAQEAAAVKGSDTTGAGAFIPTSDMMKGFGEKS